MKKQLLPGFWLFLVFLLIPGSNYAASYFWVNTSSGNWNNAANWSASSGGAGGAGIPGLTDFVTFDGNGNGNCTVTASVTLATGGGMIMKSGYLGTISFSAGVTFVAGTAHFTQYGGTFTGNNGNITIQGRFRKYGGTFTCPTGQLDLQGDSVIFSGGVFNHNNGTVRFSGQNSGGNQYIVGNQTFRNVNFHGTYAPTYFFIDAATTLNTTNDLTLTDNGGTGSVVMRNGTVAVQGNITPTGTNSVTGDAVVLINGTGNQTIFGGPNNLLGHLPAVQIQKTAGTLFLQGFICVNCNWTWVSGTVNVGTSTVVFRRSIYPCTITGTHSLNNIELKAVTSGLVTVAAGTTLTALGTMTYSGTFAITVNGTGTISVKGDIFLNNTANGGGGAATISIDGSTNQNMTSTVPSGNSALCNVVISKGATALSLSGVITSTRNWTLSSGTLSAGSSSVVFISNSTTFAQTISGNQSLFNAEFSALAAGTNIYTIASGTTVNVTGDLLISGTNPYQLNTGTINATGNITVTNTSLSTGGNATITITGTANQTLTGSGVAGGGKLPHVSISKTGGTLAQAASILSIAGNWNQSSGTVTTTGATTWFYNTMTITTATMAFNNVVIAGTLSMGSNLTVNGTFTINAAASFDASVSNYALTVRGNWTNNNSAAAASFNERAGTVNFTGSSSQNITLAAAAHKERFYNLVLNNAAGLSSSYTIEIQNQLTFTAGLLTPSAAKPVEFMAGSSWTGAGNSSFINGKCSKYGTTAFTFPVGKGSFLRTASISAPAVATDFFTAEYFNSSANASYSFLLKDPVLQIFDQCEYWIIDRSGSSNVNVTLSWNAAATPSCSAGVLSDLRVARWDGSMWQNHGNGATTGNGSAGTVTTSAAVTSFSPFTIASVNILSPLPVEFLSFTATASGSQVVLDWATATETDNDYFTVERSVDGANFEPVTRVESKAPGGYSSQTLRYTATDYFPAQGVNYYRIRQTDFDGTTTCSGIAAVSLETTAGGLHLFPNPAGSDGFTIMTGEGSGELLISDLSGKLIYSTAVTGKTMYNSGSLPALEAGIYLVSFTGPEKRFTERLVITGK